jgi:hypothetical protein
LIPNSVIKDEETGKNVVRSKSQMSAAMGGVKEGHIYVPVGKITYVLGKWLSDCCLNPNEQLFSYRLLFDDKMMMNAFYLTNLMSLNSEISVSEEKVCLVFYFSV